MVICFSCLSSIFRYLFLRNIIFSRSERRKETGSHSHTVSALETEYRKRLSYIYLCKITPSILGCITCLKESSFLTVSEKLTGSNKFSGMLKTRIKSSNFGYQTHQKSQKIEFGHLYI